MCFGLWRFQSLAISSTKRPYVIKANYSMGVPIRLKRSTAKMMDKFYKKIYKDIWRFIAVKMVDETSCCVVVNKFCSQDPSALLVGSTRLEIVSPAVAEIPQSEVKNNKRDVNISLDSPAKGDEDGDQCLGKLDEEFHSTYGQYKAVCDLDFKGFSSSALRLYIKPQADRFLPPAKDAEGITNYYLMDLASVLPVIALDVGSEDDVLDMCAAPGGKSVAILQHLSDRGVLVVNDSVNSRRQRLGHVITNYLPTSKGHLVHLRCLDGVLFGRKEPQTYDKVLVDAPCSHERHVIQDAFEHGGWSLAMSKEHSDLQLRLIVSGLQALKPGGSLVYSTCSISPFENHLAVFRAVRLVRQQFRMQVEIRDTSHIMQMLPAGTFHEIPVPLGNLVVPYKGSNWGPIYFCKLTVLS